MYHKRTRQLVELCPQCCKSVDSSVYRMVQDSCGHSKCRICLLQEVSGCLMCEVERRSRNSPSLNRTLPFVEVVSQVTKEATRNDLASTNQERTSVIKYVSSHSPEPSPGGSDRPATPSSPIDKETCLIFEQSLQKDILFPENIVKRSTTNFYHLKRILSERFFNEDRSKKEETSNDTSVIERNNNVTEDHNSVSNTECIMDKGSYTTNRLYILENQIKSHENNTSMDQTGPIYDTVTRHNGKNNTVKEQGYIDLRTNSSNSADISNDIEIREGVVNNPLACTFCQKVFSSKKYLTKHKIRIHNKNSRFICKQCNKSFKDNYALKAHTRTHTSEKPFSCSSCGMAFSERNNLKRHERKHENNRKYICDYCGLKFLEKYHLDDHSITHSNEKRYQCAMCDKKFRYRRCLKRHLKTYNTNPSQFKCSQCESVFRRKDNLDRHIKNSHTDHDNEETDAKDSQYED